MKKNFILSVVIFLIICFNLVINAQVSNYNFSAFSGSYSPITAGTLLWSGSFNDSLSSPVNIQNGFTFNGITYYSVRISSNGYIVFGSTAPANNLNLPLSDNTSYSGAVSAFGAELNNSSGSSEVRYQLLNNEFIIQWTDMRRLNVSNDRISFQVRLNIYTNEIKVVYGGTISTGVSNNYPQVGLRGAANSDFNNREVIASANWNSSRVGTENNKTCYFGGPVKPFSGLTFSFYPFSNVLSKKALNFTSYGSQNEITALATEGNYIWVGTTGGVFKRDRSSGLLISFYSTNNGLSSNNITKIVIDGQGNKWFCTNGGGVSELNSNSSTWTNYNTGNGMPDIIVNDMLIDFDGNLWFATPSGAAMFDGTNWTNFNTSNSGLVSNSINCIAEDDYTNIWFGTASGLSKYDYSGNWTTFSASGNVNSDSLINNDVICMSKDNLGNMWFGTSKGASKFDGTSFTNYNDSITGYNFLSYKVKSIYIDVNGNIWFGNSSSSQQSGVSKFIPLSDTWTNYSTTNGLADPVVNAIVVDAQSNKWFGTNNGLSRLDGITGTFGTPVQSVNSLGSNTVNSVAVDASGNKWFGTSNGVSKYNSTMNVWTTLTTSDGLVDNDVKKVAIDGSGNIWFGTVNGACRLSTSNIWTTMTKLNGDWITSITFDSNSNVWFGTFNTGACKLSNANTLTTYTISNSSIPSNQVSDIIMDTHNNVWFSTVKYLSGSSWVGGGVAKLSPSNAWTIYNSHTGAAIPDDAVNAISIDANNDIWIATDSGLSRFDTISWKNLTETQLHAIANDAFGNHWFATRGSSQKGLIKLTENFNELIYSPAQGLPDYNVNDIIIDQQSKMWVCTDGGVAEVECKTPVANFTFDTACFPGMTTFTNLSNNIDASTKYLWDINSDGTYDYATKDIYHQFPSIGNYQVKLLVINDNCRDSVVKTVRVNSLPVITISFSGGSNICSGSTKTLNANITNYSSSLQYNYLWSTGASTSFLNVSSTGTYSVSVNDQNCYGSPVSQSINVVMPDPGQNICLVTVDTAINKNIITWDKAPASGTYSYNIYKEYITAGNYTLTGNVLFSQNPVFIDTSSNPTIKPERYKMTVVDTCGNESAKSSSQRTIHLTLSTTGSNINLNWTGYEGYSSSYNIYRGSSPGNLSYVTTVPNSTTSWTDNAPPSCILYYLVTTDKGSSCDAGYSASLSNIANNGCTVPPSPNISGPSDVCQYQVASLDAGSGFSSYKWSYNSATTQSVNVNSTNIYSVTVTNSCGCTAIDSHLLTVHNQPAISINSGTTICSGYSTQLSASGGQTYLWSPSAGLSATNISNPVASPTLTTTYNVTATDSYGCSSTDTVSINVNPSPIASISYTGQTTFCAGGSLLLNANTGTGLNYQWKHYSSNINAAVNPAYTATQDGVYRVEVTNTYGCSSISQPVTITVSSLPNTTVTSLGNTTFCQGSSVQLIVSTGNGNIYQWKNNGSEIGGATGSSFTANFGGNYSVFVTDTNNCSASSSVTIVTVNNLPSATITPSGITDFCSGDSVTLNSSQVNGYQYQWLRNGLFISTAAGPAYSANVTGNYSVLITDGNNCSNTSNIITVTAYPLPVAIISNTGALTFCSGNSVYLSTMTGSGYTYQWKINGSDLTGGTGSTITATSGGSYFVNVIDGNNCSATSSPVVVTVQSLPSVLAIPQTSGTFCQGDSVIINATQVAGYSYLWKRNGFVLTGSTVSSYTADMPGIYSVQVTDGNSCSNVSSGVTVNVNPLPSSQINYQGSLVFCSGNSVYLSIPAGAGYSYQWMLNGSNLPGSTGSSVNAFTGGDYSVFVSDPNNCSSVSSQLSLSENSLPLAAITTQTSTSFCLGDSVILHASVGTDYNYVWKKNGFSISGAVNSDYVAKQSGNYSVEITNGNGCINTSPVAPVTANPLPNAIISNIGPLTFCAGGSVTLTTGSVQGNNYQWEVNGSNIPGSSGSTYAATSGGNYSVMIVDGNNCEVISPQVLVTVNNLPNAAITLLGPSMFCQGDSVIMKGISGSGYTYQWMKNGNSINGATDSIYVTMQSGDYTLEINDLNGCSVISQGEMISVNSYPPAIITVIGGNPVECEGNPVDMVVGSGLGYMYQWKFNGSNLSGGTSSSYSAYFTGNYSVEVTSNYGCNAISTPQPVTINPLPNSLIISTGPTVFCDGSTDTLKVIYDANCTYQWRLNNFDVTGWTNNFAVVSQPGLYDITAVDMVTGCISNSNYTTINVNQNPVPQIIPTGHIYLCIKDSMNLSTYATYNSYHWSTNQTASDIYISTGGNYGVTVADNNGCIGTDTMNIVESVINAPSICMVTVDTGLLKNKVIWEKDTSIHNILEYNIYKESSVAGVYNFIGTVPYASMSEFVDNVSSPLVHSDRYRITAVDTCGNETAQSPPHKTLHLSVAKNGMGNGYILNWIDPYEGFTFSTYYIYRKDSTGTIIKLDSIANTYYSYTDTTSLPGRLIYYVSVKKSTPCYTTSSAKAIGGPYSESVSNPDDNGIAFNTGGIISNTISYIQLTIYPNPMKDKTTVEFTNPLHKEYQLTITDLAGKTVKEINGIRNDRVELSSEDLPSSGFYLIEVRGEKLFRGKITVEK